MGDIDKAAKEKIFKQLDGLKDLQSHHVPELIKQIKAYEEARAGLSLAEERVNEAWDKVANAVGMDNDWGKALKEINNKNNEILIIEKEWESILEMSFVQMINKGLSQETKNTATKDADVRRAMKRLEQDVKTTGKSTMKSKKKDAKAMDEYNMVLQEAERKKELITADVTYQCQMTHFMILQSISKALKQKMESYERIYGKSKELNEYLGTCIKIQPDFASAPKASIMQDIYKEKKGKKKGRSQTMSSGQLSSEIASASGGEAKTKGPIPYSRVAEISSKNGSSPSVPTLAIPNAGTTRHGSMYMSTSPRSAVADTLDLPPPPLSNAGQPKARAKWPFAPQKEGDLAMKAGDIMNILNSVGPWWMAERDGVVGRIPANYVEMLATEPPQLKLPPQLPIPASTHGSGSISPRGRLSPRGSPTPTVTTMFDLPPPVDLSPRGENQPLPDLPPPVVLPTKSEDFSLPVDLPPPVLDHLPPPVLDDEVPVVPIRDELPAPVITPAPVIAPAPAPVPPAASEWQQFTTDQGYVYYYNAATGESKWTLD